MRSSFFNAYVVCGKSLCDPNVPKSAGTDCTIGVVVVDNTRRLITANRKQLPVNFNNILVSMIGFVQFDSNGTHTFVYMSQLICIQSMSCCINWSLHQFTSVSTLFYPSVWNKIYLLSISARLSTQYRLMLIFILLCSLVTDELRIHFDSYRWIYINAPPLLLLTLSHVASNYYKFYLLLLFILCLDKKWSSPHKILSHSC